MKLRHVVAVVAFFAIVAANRPASDLATRLLAALEQWVTMHPNEKLYLMTDKSVYASGENLWYRAWLLNAVNHAPNTISRLMYVELIDSNQRSVLRQKVEVDAGAAHGDLYLPPDLPQGSYTLRAYTSWMRNFDPDFFFHKSLTILSDSVATSPTNMADTDVQVQVFPEGGEWVVGLGSVLGVLATDPWGSPLAVSGSLVDQTGEEVTTFSTDENGLGRIYVMPEPGKTYAVEVVTGFERTRRTEIQKPLEQGFTMTVNGASRQHISFSIQSSLKDASLADTDLLVLGQVRGVVFYAAQGKVGQEDFTAQIDRSRFPAGVVHFTLFTGDGTPVAQRLVYNPDRGAAQVKVEAEKQRYRRRERADLTVTVVDSAGKPIVGNLALSATNDAIEKADPYGMDIANYLLMTSDLAALVSRPGIFANPTDTEAMIAADNLMLTKGWRRFDWQKLLRGEFPSTAHPLELGQTISGRITNSNNNRVATGQNVILALLGDVKEFYDMDTDDDGRFRFDDLLFPDSTEVLVQTVDRRKRRHYDITLDSADPFAPVTPSLQYILRPQDPSYAEYLRLARERERFDRAFGLQNDFRVLGEITVTAERDNPEPPPRSSVFGSADRVIRADDIRNLSATNPLEMLQGRSAAFTVMGSGPNTTVRFNRASSINADTTPLFILDGMEVDIQSILTVPAMTVESIELVTDAANLAMYGSRGSNGVIAVNTRPGGAFYGPREGIINRPFAGYYVPRKFYAPNYAEALDIHRKPDHRATIWWEPHVYTDENGVARVNFWLSDDETDITVRVEGISQEGKPLVGTAKLTVRD